MAIEIINNQHPLFPSVKDLGRKYATTLGFMPDGGFEDYGKIRNNNCLRERCITRLSFI